MSIRTSSLKRSHSTDIQYLDNFRAQSNRWFQYKDITSNNYEHRIKLNPEIETKMDIRNQIPLSHTNPWVIREYEEPGNINHSATDWDAFIKADNESIITSQVSSHKYQTLLSKTKNIAKITNDKQKVVRDEKLREKENIKNEIIKIIRDALIFSRKNNPMIAMLPNSLNDMWAKIKEDKSMNISMSSLNISAISKQSVRSVKKYESNAFLKAWGWDLWNLAPDNIVVDIDKAYAFVKFWKTDRKWREVIRYKVVNEIMSIEEKRASQKVEKMNKKIKVFNEKKKEEILQKKKEIEEALKQEEDAIDPWEKVRMKMKESVNNKKNFFAKEKKPVWSSKKNSLGKRSSSVGNDNKRRTINGNDNKHRGSSLGRNNEDDVINRGQIIKLNAYKHIDKIWKIIHQSDSWSENTSLCKHFLNIKYSKRMDDTINKLKKKNKINAITEDNKVY